MGTTTRLVTTRLKLAAANSCYGYEDEREDHGDMRGCGKLELRGNQDMA